MPARPALRMAGFQVPSNTLSAMALGCICGPSRVVSFAEHLRGLIRLADAVELQALMGASHTGRPMVQSCALHFKWVQLQTQVPWVLMTPIFYFIVLKCYRWLSGDVPGAK